MKRRLISIGLAMCFLVGTMVGCGGKTVTEETTAQTTAPTTAEVSAPAKKQTISLFTTRIQPNADSEVMKLMEEKLGHKLEVIAVEDGKYVERLNLFYASNEMPDVFTPSNVEAIKKGATARFTEEDFKKNMPLTYDTAVKQFEEFGYVKEKVFERLSSEGKMVGVHMGSLEISYPYGNTLRTDKLAELGKSIPKTLSDWEDVFKAYKQKWPDKYPVVARGKDAPNQNFRIFIEAFGTSYDKWHLKDNQLVFGPFMPEMREALEMFQRWYKEGFIHPEFVMMDQKALDTHVLNNESIYQQVVRLDTTINAPFTPGSINENLAAAVPGLKQEWIPFPVWKEGVKPAASVYEPLSVNYTSFGRHLENDPEKLAAAMNVMDRLGADKEIVILRTYGIEGKHYDMQDNAPVIKTEFNNNDAKTKEGFGWLFNALPGRVWEIEKSLKPAIYIDNLQNMCFDENGMYSKKNIEWAFTRVNGPLPSATGEDLTVKGKTKQQEWDGVFAEVIIGRKTLEDFDKFIAEWKKEVGTEQTEVANKLYLSQWLD